MLGDPGGEGISWSVGSTGKRAPDEPKNRA